MCTNKPKHFNSIVQTLTMKDLLCLILILLSCIMRMSEINAWGYPINNADIEDDPS